MSTCIKNRIIMISKMAKCLNLQGFFEKQREVSGGKTSKKSLFL
ncbi:hypothetical protein CLOBOL_05285 [Enterocloster bolteae ATCC BAA-613]|uniref:Uncharacterized protein n=1 Tax=Enterocloster bolteae (strain ATCC BAA-613 / DSM 15670 / CCUG 46953 / JCM 12243 / WAL 16351) TaxID=411902 RepID=A8RZ07_ENTBW|nr:hypothetical protein CLOBOL_05285 [Enterocloster bolteae ATCC BAA-613]